MKLEPWMKEAWEAANAGDDERCIAFCATRSVDDIVRLLQCIADKMRLTEDEMADFLKDFLARRSRRPSLH